MQECGNFGFFDPPSCGILLSSIGPMRKAGQTMKERRPAPSGEADGIIEGRNAVTEALRAGTPIDKIYLARGETDAALGHSYTGSLSALRIFFAYFAESVKCCAR